MSGFLFFGWARAFPARGTAVAVGEVCLLKIDNEKVIEAARQLGEKVSVPSNSISQETAEKIRIKFSKKSK